MARSRSTGLLSFEGRAMASLLRLTVSGGDPGPPATVAAAAWAAVRDEFEASESAMSRFRQTSEITELNRLSPTAPAGPVSIRLRQALMACDRARRLTGGLFDPRVLLDLERLGDHGAPIGQMNGAHIARAGHAGRVVDWLPSGRARLAEPVDLGGIGKGLALRWAANAVRRLGVRSFLLDAGGDLVTAGEPPEGGPWRVGLEDPFGGHDPLAVVASWDGAVATSSIRRRHWVADGRAVHHLIDAQTGEPGGEGLLAVTVAGPDPGWAEVWSKTLFLEGLSGIATAARRRGLAAWWIAEDRTIEMTPAGRARTLWVAGEAR
jgi:thiamine biosynthesis lipoprotein